MTNEKIDNGIFATIFLIRKNRNRARADLESICKEIKKIFRFWRCHQRIS